MMKLIRTQDKLRAINAQFVHFFEIAENYDDDGEETGKMDIDAYLSVRKKDYFSIIATYNTEAECIRQLDRLMDFLGSNTTSGVYDMPTF